MEQTGEGAAVAAPSSETALDERLKENVLLLADHHKATCDDPDCGIALNLLGVLLDRANIGVTKEEARRLW